MKHGANIFFVICAVWVAAVAACAFDQTQVPPVPDWILHPDAGTGGGGGGGGGGADGGCLHVPPQLPDFGTSDGALTGVWARRLLQKSERETRGEGAPWYDSSWTVYELVTVSHSGAKMREVVELCAITMPLIDGANTGFPAALIRSLPILAEEGDFLTGSNPGQAVGAAYANPLPFVRLFGLKPEAAAKTWEACKSYFDPAKLAEECPLALWPEIYDMDCDGNTGVTLDMTVGTSPTEQVYMIQRDVMTRTGTVASPDRIAGTLALEENNANLGSSKAMLKSNPPSRVLDGSTFVMVRLPAGSTCSAVQGAKFD